MWDHKALQEHRDHKVQLGLQEAKELLDLKET
jgi:hypothetical protein